MRAWEGSDVGSENNFLSAKQNENEKPVKTRFKEAAFPSGVVLLSFPVFPHSFLNKRKRKKT